MRYLKTSMALAALAYVPMAFEAATDAGAAEPAVKKSIVPAKYSGKYKDGGSDVVAEFIKTQCTGKDGFEFTAFFNLARKNGIAEEKVAHYEGLYKDKENNHGIEGRARMTLGNMIRAKGRKEGKLVGLNDSVTEVNLPKPAVSGAAASAQAAAADPAPATTEADPSTEANAGDDE